MARTAALYHRVSTADQNPALVRKELRQAARGRQLRVVLDVEETGSGRRNDRPGLQRVLEAARRGEIDHVLVWKIDRLGRSAIDLVANVQELSRLGVAFVATSQGVEIRTGGDAVSSLLLTVLAAVAEFEREIIVERTRKGLEAARERGVTLGRPRGELPDRDQVLALRAMGVSWRGAALLLGCKEWQCRRSIAR